MLKVLVMIMVVIAMVSEVKGLSENIKTKRVASFKDLNGEVVGKIEKIYSKKVVYDYKVTIYGETQSFPTYEMAMEFGKLVLLKGLEPKRTVQEVKILNK